MTTRNQVLAHISQTSSVASVSSRRQKTGRQHQILEQIRKTRSRPVR